MADATIAPFGDVLVATDFSEDAGRALDRAVRLRLREGSAIHLLHVLPKGSSSAAERAAADALRDAARDACRSLDRAPEVKTRVACGTSAAIEIVRHAHADAVDLIVCGRRGVHGQVRTRRLMRIVREAELPMLVVGADVTHPYRRALAAIDLTDSAPMIARQAMAMVAGDHGQIELTHAIRMPFGGFLGAGMKPQLVREAEEQLEQVRAAVTVPGFEVTVRLVEGDVLPAILGEAGRTETDVVVVGSHGRGRLRRAILGSVGASLIESAGLDVLVNRPLRVGYYLPE